MTIDSTKIATSTAKAASARLKSQPSARHPHSGVSFAMEYHKHGGDPDHFDRARREFEIAVASGDDIQWFANHHLQKAKDEMHRNLHHSPAMQEFCFPTYKPFKTWCTAVSCWPADIGRRMYPVFLALVP